MKMLGMAELPPLRVRDADPRDDLPCEWCGSTGPTTVNEVWCDADPAGELTRLCDGCRSMCAGP